MLRGEVDWIDLLGYCGLLIKAPGTVAKMRRDPDDFSDEVLSKRTILRMAQSDKPSVDDRLRELIPASELNEYAKSLLGFLFPSLSENQRRAMDHADAMYKRRPLLNTLRLGLLPGAYSTDETTVGRMCDHERYV
jgi:hypothetical protein